jgi:hypothetical protein
MVSQDAADNTLGFEIENLTEPIQTAVFSKAFELLEKGDFVDMLLGCFRKTA